MPRRKHQGPPGLIRWLVAHVHSVRTWATSVTRWGWQTLRHLRCSPPIEVLLTDPARRRSLERHLRHALTQLQRTVTSTFPGCVAVVVQQVITTDRQLAGCCQIVQRPDGRRFALLRLALQVNGKPFGPDELLAVLAEQYLSLATQVNGATSILVPVELELTPPATRHDGLPADPLALHRNGSGPAAHTREHAA